MKKCVKFIRNNLLGLVVGAIICGCTIATANTLLSKDIGYDKSNSTQYGATATNVEQALNELYEKASHVG